MRWLAEQLTPKLSGFDCGADVRDFVVAKIESVMAATKSSAAEVDSAGVHAEFIEADNTFHRTFAMPPEEKLVNFFAAAYWHSGFSVPRQGWLYISDNHACFRALVMGKETRLALPWTTVTALEVCHSTPSPDVPPHRASTH